MALAVLVPACGPRVRDRAPADLQPIVTALDLYCFEHADYPPTLEDAAVRERLTSYSPGLSFSDRWGRPFEYRRLGPGSFELRSLGRDGQSGTADDSLARRGISQ